MSDLTTSSCSDLSEPTPWPAGLSDGLREIRTTTLGAQISHDCESVAAVTHAPGVAVTLGELIERYLAHAKKRNPPLRPATFRTYARGIRVLESVCPDAKAIDVDTIDPYWAQTLHDRAADQHGDHQAQKMVRVLRAAWNHARRYTNDLQGEPFAALTMARVTYQDLFFDQGWLPRMLELVVQACEEGVIDEIRRDFFIVTISTGARPWCEVLKMRWDDVDESGGVILFRYSKTRPRAIPMQLLHQRARDALDRQRGRHPTWVWHMRGQKHAGETTFGNHWPALREFARSRGQRMTTLGGRNIVLYHAGRHATASYMLGELRLEPQIVQQFLGHADLNSMRHYAHLQVEHLRQAAASVAQSMSMSREGKKMEYRFDRVRLAKAVESLTDAQREQLDRKIDTLRRYANGSRTPDVDWVGRLASVVGVEPNYFYGIGDGLGGAR